MSAHLLVVEDNVQFVENLREILETLGHEVRSAGTIAEAVKEGRDWVEVALVDLRLPDGDGTALAEVLKAQNPDCEVILLTGYASVESASAAVRAGVWDYLIKPTATPDLLAAVSKAVRHVHAHLEKREMARRAQRAEKLAAVGTMTAGLSHEIRNPLNAAGLQLAVLERRILRLDPAIQPPLLSPLKLALDEIRRLDHIVRDFLQFARPAAVRLQPVSLTEVLERVVSFLLPEAERRQLGLVFIAAGTPPVPADADQLKQVFMNLSLNALDAARSKVELSVKVDADGVHVFVDDDGPGFSKDARLFEPFFTTKAQGSGLGLSISSAIISQHSGRIEAGTSPLGGARFDVFLPR